jgi:SAM-dependent methyltransferase
MLLHKLRRLRHSVESSGLRRTIADVALPWFAYSAARDKSFDARFGTDTAGSVAARELGIADTALEAQAILYLPSPPRVTRWMLRHAGIDHSEFSFIDLGCGKGRVLLIASEFDFQRAVGVEISAKLCEIARRNLALFQSPKRRCRDVRVENEDATRFEFPQENLLIHMYHPFAPELTLRVFERLGEELSLRPRKVLVAYLVYTAAVDEVDAAFAKITWLKRVRYEHSVTGQYDWLFYSNQ